MLNADVRCVSWILENPAAHALRHGTHLEHSRGDDLDILVHFLGVDEEICDHHGAVLAGGRDEDVEGDEVAMFFHCRSHCAGILMISRMVEEVWGVNTLA